MNKLMRGFTLIEVMIVVAIIGILAAIAIPNFVRFQCKSKQSEAKTNLKALYTAQQAFRGEADRYGPVTIAELESGQNELGLEFGLNARYGYSATANNVTFDGTALGGAGASGTNDMDGDTWTINQLNETANTVNICIQ